MENPSYEDLRKRIQFLEGAEISRRKAEDELLTQKTYLEELFNSAPEGIVLHDLDDIILNINAEFTRIFGYSAEEAIGNKINDLIAPFDDLREDADGLSSAVNSGERVHSETRRRHKDGTLVDVSILGAPIFTNNRQTGVYAIYRNISVRKKAVEDLRVQKIHLEELFNSAPEAIVLHDNNDVIINVNLEFTRMFGYSHDEAVGVPINQLIALTGEIKEEADQLSNTVLRGDRVNVETKRRRKDGSLIDVSILGAPVILEGEQFGVYAIYRDITDRKRAEEVRIRIQEERRMAREIQENLLPKNPPAVEGYDIAGKNVPAMNVGGDYFDFIDLGDQRLAVALGDVSGKGLPASMLMANVQATVRGQAFFNTTSSKCLEISNKLVYRSTDSRNFVSLFYGILETGSHSLCFANAGQNLPVLISSGGTVKTLKNRDLALGLKEDVEYGKDVVNIERGDTLVIYSDGLIEVMDCDMNEFGEERLKDLLIRNRNESSAVIIDRVLNTVSQFCDVSGTTDDMTIVVLKRL